MIFFSSIVFGGLGSDNTTSPNPTGGFGSGSDLSTSNPPNPTGGFGTDPGNVVTPLGVPPPPPDPVPLDGGVSLLIACALGLGVRKLYLEIKNQ